ncbi:hypothetical protein [Paenibacillus xylanexedens]|uniref:Zn ribbon nucleic-acid-binding protein n=1 Tax=Paenibacillus xylanexedens TaxID=528191 RepID=A0ABS4RQZ9_PAEXY|nr:hypothetical protein [Paenibacillus xylanexedens]MBP2245308.1 Zn ribbon nucleic-acid-binding protein [Paenibacillus xylanexedens]
MKTILDVKRRLAAARCPYPVSLMDDLEEAYAEIERLKAEKVELWDCPECGFTYDACHEDIDPATGEGNGNHTCPVCENADLERENDRLRKELEEARYALNAISMGEWACTFDEQGLEVWTTRRINPGRIAREALAVGQEGEGNQ